jgi:hypothetical protein
VNLATKIGIGTVHQSAVPFRWRDFDRDGTTAGTASPEEKPRRLLNFRAALEFMDIDAIDWDAPA